MKALLLIDIQNGLTKKKTLYRERLFFDTLTIARRACRASDSKIIFIQHNNQQLTKDSLDWEIDKRLEKKEKDLIIQKKHGNAFQNTNFKTMLTELGVSTIIICGLVSHGCVKATCLGGVAAGFETLLLRNGHTNWNKDSESRIIHTEADLAEKSVKLIDLDSIVIN